MKMNDNHCSIVADELACVIQVIVGDCSSIADYTRALCAAPSYKY